MKSRAPGSAPGYTLIEILIVMFIISIVTSIALLSIGKNQNKQLESFANEFSQMVTLAEEQAMLQPSILGLSVRADAFEFSAFHPGVGEKKPAWIAVEERVLGKRRIPDDIQVGIEAGGNKTAASGEDDAASSVPQIIISTNGDLTPFTVYVGRKGEKPRYMIKGDADGNVTNKELS